MRFIFVMSVIVVLLLVTVGYDLLEKYFKKENPKSTPNDLEELEKEVTDKTDSYNEVVEKVNETEEIIKKIKKKTETKK